MRRRCRAWAGLPRTFARREHYAARSSSRSCGWEVGADSDAARRQPLFVDGNGKVKDKHAVVDGWRAALGARGAADPATRAVTGHSARQSGAEMLARAGWHLWQVHYMGRWASDAVAGYVEEAWAERTADWTGPAGPGAAFAETGSLHSELRSLRASIQELDTMVADCKRPPAVQSGPSAEEIQAEAERQAARLPVGDATFYNRSSRGST